MNCIRSTRSPRLDGESEMSLLDAKEFQHLRRICRQLLARSTHRVLAQQVDRALLEDRGQAQLS